METDKDVDEDGHKGEDHTDDSTIGDVFSHRRTNLRTADDRATITHIWVLKGFYIGLCNHTSLLQCIVKDGLSLVVHSGIVGLNIPVGRYTHRLSFCTEGNDSGVGWLTGVLTHRVDKGIIEHVAHILSSHFLVERHNIVATTGEVDALAQATHTETNQEEYGSHSPNSEALAICTHEVELSVLHHVARQGGAESKVEPLVLLHAVLVNDASEINSGEERAADTDDERGGETTYRTGTEDIEDDTREDRSEVRVEDS